MICVSCLGIKLLESDFSFRLHNYICAVCELCKNQDQDGL
jgi:hypothetical protein